MNFKTSIYNKLSNSFAPEHLEVIDESHLHEGHQGYKEGLTTHIKIIIRSAQFAGLNKIILHKAIYEVIDEEIKSGLHAISIEANS